MGLNLKFEDLDQPWKVGETDLSSVYATADAFRWPFYYVSQEYGFPTGANFGTQVVPADIPYTALGLLRWVTGSPVLAVNTFVLLSFAFTALAMLWICSRFGIRRLVSFPISLATAWAPYVFVRLLYGHVVLASIWTIPLFLYLILSSQNNNLKLSYKKRVALGLLIGASSAYYGFFSFLIATFVLVGMLAAEIYNSRRVRFVAASKELGCHLTFVLPSLAHVALDRLRGDGTPVQRGVAESLQYAGDLRNVFIPFGFPQVFSDTLTLRQEFEWSPVSALTVIGIILMLLMFSSGDDQIGIIRTVLLVGILFFAAGGLGIVFADVIFPGFRAWARMMPFIITAAHLGLGLLLTRFQNYSSTLKAMPIVFVLLGTLAGLQVRDARQGISPQIMTTADPRQLGSYLDAIKTLRTEISSACGTLQLPLMSTFEGGTVGGKDFGKVSDGDQFWPGILSDGYRWSYGAIKTSYEGDYWFTADQERQKLRGSDISDLCAVWDTTTWGLTNPEYVAWRRPFTLNTVTDGHREYSEPTVIPSSLLQLPTLRLLGQFGPHVLRVPVTK